MDDDTLEIIYGLLFMSLFILFPVVLVLSITACIALSSTREWQKARAAASSPSSSSIESAPLNPDEEAEEEDELDFLDSDEEADYHALKAEQAADKLLTFRQKFRKDFKKIWTGGVGKDAAKIREREERRKVARAVAREIERLERRRVRRGERGLGEGLPSYDSSVAAPVGGAGDRKE